MPDKLIFQEHLDLISNQLKIALSSGIVATWIVDIETNTVLGDPALFDFFGLEYVEGGNLPLEHFISSMHPADRERVLAAIEQTISENVPYHIEYRIFDVNNKIRHVLASGKLDNPESPSKFLGFLVDITEKKQLEEEKAQFELALKEKNAALNGLLKQYEFVANFIPQQVWTATPDGATDFVNHQTLEYFGADHNALYSFNWQNFVHPDDLELVQRNWEQSLTTEDIYEVEFRLRAKDGSYHWHLARAVPFFKDNKVEKWFGTNTDIEDQKRNQEKKDEFLSIASHELKTPLTTVKAFFQLLQKTIKGEMAHTFVDKAGKQLNRLEQLINDLLDVSKVNAGKMNYNIEPFNFAEALKESVDNVKNIYTTYQIVIEESADVIFNGDRFRIEQVLNNLISNAIKYSPGADKVVVRTQVIGKNLIVSVQDFGIGIAPENIHNIFERYYRVDSSSLRFQGLGLGLYISSEIIKRHNGNIWIDSEVGKGSTFSFMLPLNGKFDLNDRDTDHQTYYHSDFVNIKIDEDKQMLESEWLGYQNYDSVKKGAATMLDLVRKNGTAKVLNDNTNVTGNWSDGIAWGREVWFPEMQKAGVRYFAWIYPQSIFNKISAQKSVNLMLDQITLQFFTDKEEAVKWLDSINVPQSSTDLH